ncbi:MULTISPECIES: response regulator transcription factor [unclassified Pseudovibrio]|uniref:response regulator transcription factor n=1 Tax=unclassified Pseudovibrio TaxID=2627060 RepID=UPI0007AE5EC4|nr:MULTISPECIES: response regulator transcription factor [unclassified Pseudovibrio]KZK94507.1 Transcriptional activator protein CopR [Pseudovibrio sp. W74]KZL06907.1 Transcriptional activator protein CopR [Pseudovibrio sp. Ad14]
MLQDGDAIEIVSFLREEGSDLPILMLTARDTIEDRIDGLEAGADDYLIKRFAMSGLVARMRALLRRPSSVSGKTEAVGSLSYNFKSRTSTVNAVALPRRELLVLESLISNRGHVVTKDDNVAGGGLICVRRILEDLTITPRIMEVALLS